MTFSLKLCQWYIQDYSMEKHTCTKFHIFDEIVGWTLYENANFSTLFNDIFIV